MSALPSSPGLHQAVPELAELAAALAGRDVLLDGELVCLDADGRPDFHRLRRRLSAHDTRAGASLAGEHPATLIVFDVLHLDGRAVRRLAYQRRRSLVAHEISRRGPTWQISEPLPGELDAVLTVTRAHELEGIVAKRLDAPYEPGRRSGAWLKHKHRRLETFAMTGCSARGACLAVDWTPSFSPARAPTVRSSRPAQSRLGSAVTTESASGRRWTSATSAAVMRTIA